MATNSLTRIQDIVRIILEELDLCGTRITMAVSGGPDSLCMLHVLHSISKATEIKLWGAHLDHGIRVSESREDAEFVKTTFERMGIPYSIKYIDTPALSIKERTSQESTARTYRHLFLAKVAQSNSSSVTALGHNAGDQAETVLMHLIRGTGLKGLSGMQQYSSRTIAQVKMKLLRPLLFIPRKDIERYCKEADLHPRIDKTNEYIVHNRNAIRKNLIPVLKNHNPRIEESLIRLSKSAARDIKFLDQATNIAFLESTNVANGVVSINTMALKTLPDTLMHRVLKRGASFLMKDSSQLTMAQVDAMAKLITGPAGNSIDIPGCITVTNNYDELIIHRSGQDIVSLPKLPRNTQIKIPGVVNIPGWKIETSIQLTPESFDASTGNNHKVWISHDPSVKTMSVRPRQSGDRFQPKGMAREKKLQDFMVDMKIPRRWRDRTPVVVKNHRGVPKIVWVVGWRIADWAIVNPGETSVCIKFSRT